MSNLSMIVAGSLAVSAVAAHAEGEKNNVLGLNPLAAAFGYYSGEYGRFIKDGTAEVNVPFTYYSYDLLGQKIGGFGVGVNYRLYHTGNREGLFYGAGVDYRNTSNKLELYGETIFDVSYHKVIPAGLVGYRWTWGSGFTFAPSLSLGYRISTGEDQKKTYDDGFGGTYTTDYTLDDSEKSGVDYSIGLGFGWNF